MSHKSAQAFESVAHPASHALPSNTSNLELAVTSSPKKVDMHHETPCTHSGLMAVSTSLKIMTETLTATHVPHREHSKSDAIGLAIAPEIKTEHVRVTRTVTIVAAPEATGVDFKLLQAEKSSNYNNTPDRIAIGAGIVAGVGLLALLLYFFAAWRRTRAKKTPRSDVETAYMSHRDNRTTEQALNEVQRRTKTRHARNRELATQEKRGSVASLGSINPSAFAQATHGWNMPIGADFKNKPLPRRPDSVAKVGTIAHGKRVVVDPRDHSAHRSQHGSVGTAL